jgi:hypothetical protein
MNHASVLGVRSGTTHLRLGGGAIPAAVATPVRRITAVQLLGTLAYVLLGIYGKPPGLPMPFGLLLLFLILTGPLDALLGRLFDRLGPKTRA